MYLCRRCNEIEVVYRGRGSPPFCPPCRVASRAESKRKARERRPDRHRAKTGERYPDKAIIHEEPCDYCRTPVPVGKRNQWKVVCEACLPAHKQGIADRKREAIKARYAADPSRYLRRRIQIRLERGGLTMDWYDQRAGRCGICGTTEPGGQGGWHIDHDHRCCNDDKSLPFGCAKCIRGILCNQCNIGLGYFKDDPDILRAALAWVEGHRVAPLPSSP